MAVSESVRHLFLELLGAVRFGGRRRFPAGHLEELLGYQALAQRQVDHGSPVPEAEEEAASGSLRNLGPRNLGRDLVAVR